MVSWFFMMMWIGDVFEMYARARRQGTGRFTSLGDALFWPWEIGRYLSEHYTETYE